MLKIAICDDEKFFAEKLKKSISKYMEEKILLLHLRCLLLERICWI